MSERPFDVWPYNRSDLLEWWETEDGGMWVPKEKPLPRCTCGSAAVKGPGHSHWCDIERGRDEDCTEA